MQVLCPTKQKEKKNEKINKKKNEQKITKQNCAHRVK